MDIRDCVVFWGPELTPYRCDRFTTVGDTIQTISRCEPCNRLEQGTLVIIPGLINSHTHIGDACLPDGATGMTLEQGFFRPNGYKYRELAKQTETSHYPHIANHLRYMARTGTVCHIDFREQGKYGCELLRRASEETGVRSVILGQFDQVPLSQAEVEGNQATLGKKAIATLKAVLSVADGISESTMNNLPDPVWQQLYQLTQPLGKLRGIHCLENDGYRSDSLRLFGRGDLERALTLYHPHLVIHATVANDREIAMLSAWQANVVLNPRANSNLGLPFAPIAKLMGSNANLLLGTDNGLLNSPNLLAELDFTYKVAKSQFGDAVHPDPRRILQMATSNIQGVLDSDTVGYLAPGLPADFVVLNFYQPHLRASQHLAASVVSRVTPADVLATVRQGQGLFVDPACPNWSDSLA
ncbi:MAG: amidohydrolase family protein [Leptolyngbyaceae bacterium]|nr:amidohydrolase family protein [Leptolyngbyaceae bacterium]